MRIRKLVAGVTLGSALLVGAVAAPAQAAPAPATQAVPTAGVMGEMVFYDDFWTQSECRQVGRDGQTARMWKVYSCQESLWDWDLYVGY
ncbi:hypothetical protein OHA98_41455 [Streptomyces sp. NBC_00654]|uniref:hypothetical protein n=1 Tax=Streptomyces sp. NBC_00654 TaxID=2975799 RepID=UPI0022530B3D|nr:hypothetical protein [Streptomyces sp. NBC_00654]MCX4971081.1 hypothetical protein [Streptomyces sp. NBC_00654]